MEFIHGKFPPIFNPQPNTTWEAKNYCKPFVSRNQIRSQIYQVKPQSVFVSTIYLIRTTLFSWNIICKFQNSLPWILTPLGSFKVLDASHKKPINYISQYTDNFVNSQKIRMDIKIVEKNTQTVWFQVPSYLA